MTKNQILPFKQFELTLTCRDKHNNFQVLTFDKIENDDLMSILAQLPLIIARINKILVEKKLKSDDDDIPF